MKECGQLHAPAALPPRKEPPVPIGLGGWVDLRASLDDLEMRKFLTVQGLELRSRGVTIYAVYICNSFVLLCSQLLVTFQLLEHSFR
jgi:hypothetical protein